MKAMEQHFPVVLFVMLTFESVDEILKSDYSNEGYRAVRFRFRTKYYAVHGGFNF